MALERGAALGGQRQARHGLAVADLLVDRDEPRRREPTGVAGEIAIGELGLPAKVNELLPAIDGESSEDFQSAGISNKVFWRHAGFIGRPPQNT